MPETLPDIIYEKLKTMPTVDSPNAMYQIPFYKDADYLDNIESRVNFIKACEKLVRTNDRYSKYINYLKKVVGLDHCQVMPGISDNDAPIEMHHGPILTLFDYCDIALEYFILKKWKITTFRIADYILEEHWRNKIQIVMLSETSHQEVHEREIFINYRQGFGDIAGFVKKHRDAISDLYVDKIDRYIDKSMQYDSNDFGIFELSDALYKK